MEIQTDGINKIEQKLFELGNYINDVWQFLPIPIAYLSPLGVILDVNRALEELLNYSKDEIVESNWIEHFPHQEKIAQIQEWTLQKGSVKSKECSIRNKKGKEKPVSISTLLRKDTEGNAIGYFAALVDVSERKRAEEALKASQEKYRRLVEDINDGYMVLAREGNIVFANTKMAEISGYELKELIGETVFKFTLPEFMPYVQKLRERVEQGRQVRERLEGALLNKDGDRVPIEMSLKVVDYEDEPAVAVIVRDITERKRVEEALRESEELSRGMLHSAATGIYIVQDGKFQYVSPLFEQISGYTSKELIGTYSLDYVHPDDRETVRKKAIENLKGESISPYEFRFIRKDGELVWVLEKLASIQYRGQPAAIASFMDISERKRAEEENQKLQDQLIRTQKMESLGRLAGGVAHDFNNLLTAISGYSEMGMSRLPQGDPLREDLEQVVHAARHAASLTMRLLAFSRRQVLQPKVLDLNAVVADTEKMLRRIIGEDIELVTVLGREPGYVKADAVQIEQVIMNLAVNASDAMPQGGEITIKVEKVTFDQDHCKLVPERRPGRFVCLSVEDTGVGINKAIVDRIFEPFFTTKEPEYGTGLGLSIVYGIVKQHEGWITVYSEPGQGAMFRVYLPTFSVKAEDETEEKISLEELRGSGERILLAEDGELVRKFAAKALVENGYVVFEATSAEEALDIFVREKGNFHLVFSDVVLPDKDGLELVDQLLGRKPDLPVLLCSGYADKKSRWRLIQDRGFRFLQKPYALADMLRAIRETMEAHSQTRRTSHD